MNAPLPTPAPRERIAEFICTFPLNTVSEIASKLKLPETRVANEINALRTEGLIDCERAGTPAKLRYRASVSRDEMMSAVTCGTADAINLPADIKPGSRKAQIWYALRDGKRMNARQLCLALHVPAGTLDPTISEMMHAQQLARSKAGGIYVYFQPGNAMLAGPVDDGSAADGKHAPAAQAADGAIPAPRHGPVAGGFDPKRQAEADKKKRADDSEPDRMALLGVIANIRHAIGDPFGKIMLHDMAEHIRAIYDIGEAHKRACLQWEQTMMTAIGEDGVRDVAEAIARLKAELAAARQARADLQEQFAGMVSPTLEAREPAGYIMTASKRKPRRITKPETAREAAISAIRAGAQRAEVFALVPVGRAVRGAEWREAQP